MLLLIRDVFGGGGYGTMPPQDQWNLLISGGFHVPTGAEPPPWKEKIQAPAPGQIPEYAPEVIVYAVIAHQTNISYTNGVPSANGRAGRVKLYLRSISYSLKGLKIVL